MLAVVVFIITFGFFNLAILSNAVNHSNKTIRRRRAALKNRRRARSRRNSK